MPATTTPGSDPDAIAAVAAAIAPLLRGATWLDLGSPAAVRDALIARADVVPADHAAPGDDVVVTCLQVLDGADDPAPVIEALLAHGADGATVVVSVADPAPGTWGEGPAEELRRLAPEGAQTWRVVALRGAVVAPSGAQATATVADVTIAADAPAVAHLVAFGPRAGDLAGAPAAVDVADLQQERSARRALAAELDVLRAGAGSA